MNHGGSDRPRRSPRQEPEGRQPARRQPEGRQPEGRQPEGRQPEGRQPEGRQPEGRRAAAGGEGTPHVGEGAERARQERELVLLVATAESNMQLVLAEIASRSRLAA
ncbi:unnamed protein product, partial [Closterium sp. Yama58-4]